MVEVDSTIPLITAECPEQLIWCNWVKCLFQLMRYGKPYHILTTAIIYHVYETCDSRTKDCKGKRNILLQFTPHSACIISHLESEVVAISKLVTHLYIC